MRYILLVLAMLFCINAAEAGNTLRTDVFTIDQNGFSLGYRSDYNIVNGMHMVFDADYPSDLAMYVIERVNAELVDIEITYSFSDVDYDHSSEIIGFGAGIESFNKMYAPNRIFLHVGRGWAQGLFAANLRAYENGAPACFIRHGKDAFLNKGASFETQAEITIHEIYHCLLWGHSSNNPYSRGFDFTSQDNNEVLQRLYDKDNHFNVITVNIETEQEVTGFVGLKKNLDKSVFTHGKQVKIIPGRYRIDLDNTYVCKSKKVKCKRLKKAKKFKFKEGHDYRLYSDDKGKVRIEKIN